MRLQPRSISLAICCLWVASAALAQTAAISGIQQVWHSTILDFNGPFHCENDSVNPFSDYRLEVTFSSGGTVLTVPGFFAADGNAAESSADCGDVWRVKFMAPKSGTWNWSASFVEGPNTAIGATGSPGSIDGLAGSFSIAPSDKSLPDLRAHGLLEYVNAPFFRFRDSREWFLRNGVGSPENLLAYADFDSTFTDGAPTDDDIHEFLPHVADWNPGDPEWQGGKGHGLIGALNYLRSEEINSIYFLSLSLKGDGDDVWPWNGPDERNRYDVSKLAQWDIALTHMDAMGISQHMVTQERENDQLLDLGDLGDDRKLYYRELIARFGHHPGMIWDLGEENTNTDTQRLEFIDYVSLLDPYGHPVIIHSYAFDKQNVYPPLLGNPNFDGMSMHIASNGFVGPDVEEWRLRSDSTGRPWDIFMSEIGPALTGLEPDTADPTRDVVRAKQLWGLLMHGASGVEWYMGRDNDVDLEDFRSRQEMYRQVRVAYDLWERIPYPRMKNRNDLVDRYQTYCFALNTRLFMVHLPNGDYTDLMLDAGDYRWAWYDPRVGWPPIDMGTFNQPSAGEFRIENPPTPGEDWMAIVLKQGGGSALRLESEWSEGSASLINGEKMRMARVIPPPGIGDSRVLVRDTHGEVIFSDQKAAGIDFLIPYSEWEPGSYFVELVPVEQSTDYQRFRLGASLSVQEP